MYHEISTGLKSDVPHFCRHNDLPFRVQVMLEENPICNLTEICMDLKDEVRNVMKVLPVQLPNK